MKKIVYVFALTTASLLVLSGCKNQAKEAATSEEKEVVEAPAVAETFNVDLASSEITWKGSKPTGTHNGTVQLSEGVLMMNDGALQGGKFTIDMTSIISLDLEGEMKENLESHLKGTVEGKEGDFFNVTKYPNATFEMTGSKEEGGKTMLEGNLTIKDKTHNISFPATVTTNGNQVTIESETFSIDRTKWDVNYGSKSVFDNLGDKFINDEMELSIKVVAQK